MSGWVSMDERRLGRMTLLIRKHTNIKHKAIHDDYCSGASASVCSKYFNSSPEDSSISVELFDDDSVVCVAAKLFKSSSAIYAVNHAAFLSLFVSEHDKVEMFREQTCINEIQFIIHNRRMEWLALCSRVLWLWVQYAGSLIQQCYKFRNDSIVSYRIIFIIEIHL